jgi:molybdate-binding protein
MLIYQGSKSEFDEILKSKLILREEGSGTRKVLEDKLVDLRFNLNH